MSHKKDPSRRKDPSPEKIVRGTKIIMIKDYIVWGDNTNGLVGTIYSVYRCKGEDRYITKYPSGEFGEPTLDMFEVLEDESK